MAFLFSEKAMKINQAGEIASFHYQCVSAGYSRSSFGACAQATSHDSSRRGEVSVYCKRRNRIARLFFLFQVSGGIKVASRSLNTRPKRYQLRFCYSFSYQGNRKTKLQRKKACDLCQKRNLSPMQKLLRG